MRPRVRRTSTSGRGRPSRAASSSTCRTTAGRRTGSSRGLSSGCTTITATPTATNTGAAASHQRGPNRPASQRQAAQANPSSAARTTSGPSRSKSHVAVAELRDPVAPLPPERREPERQTRDEQRSRGEGADLGGAQERGPAQRQSHARQRDERDELGRERTEREQAQHRVVALCPREVESGERRERRLDVQPARHLGAPEQERSDDPHRR